MKGEKIKRNNKQRKKKVEISGRPSTFRWPYFKRSCRQKVERRIKSPQKKQRNNETNKLDPIRNCEKLQSHWRHSRKVLLIKSRAVRNHLPRTANQYPQSSNKRTADRPETLMITRTSKRKSCKL